MSAITVKTQVPRKQGGHEGGQSVQIVDAVALLGGGLVSIGNAGHGTSTSRGRAEKWAAGEGQIIAGLVKDSVTGDTGASPIVEGLLDIGGSILENIAVAGATSVNAGGPGRFVYCSTDNIKADATLTRPTAGEAALVGPVFRWRASGFADVILIPAWLRMVICALGGFQHVLNLGSFGPDLGSAANTNVITGYVMPFSGLITDYFIVCGRGPTDADVAGAFSLEVDGTDLNFASANPAIAAADVAGDKKSGTGALTATAVHAGDILDGEIDLTTAGTLADPGLYTAYVTVLGLPGF